MPAKTPIAACLLLIAACTPSTGIAPARTSTAITAADTKSRIYAIADDSMRGRQVGRIGNFMMTSYVAREMARLGLEPGGENGTWFQVIPMRLATDSASAMYVSGKPLAIFTDFAPVRPTPNLRIGMTLKQTGIPVIYGGRAGDWTMALNRADVAGRMLLLDAPLAANGEPTGTTATPMALAIQKYPEAAGIAVAALDLVTPATATGLRNGGGVLSNDSAAGVRKPVGILVTRAVAEALMKAPLATLQPGMMGQTVDMDIRFDLRPVEAPARNVIAIIRGSDPALRNQYVAIGAHSDHLGMVATPVDHDSVRAFNKIMRPEGGQTPNRQVTPEQAIAIRNVLDSLRRLRPARLDSVYNGADDDGSGSVALLEIAESFAAGARPRRSIILVWHTGEEGGLLGSAWFAEHTTVPHDSIIAQINMDMVGKGTAADLPTGGPRNLQVIGSRRLSTDLGDVVDSVNAKRSVPYIIDYSFDTPRHPQNRYCRSDHYMYARTGIPIAYISRGYHQDYHQVTDEAQYIDYQGLANVAGFVREIAIALADRDDRVRVDKPKPDPLAPCRQ
ncbi:MAG TPA: M28 family peptidase [Gemmatimonadaceae bacterium]|nr:M28 family peptidase [Gemmatimonadaceae bacterium]